MIDVVYGKHLDVNFSDERTQDVGSEWRVDITVDLGG